MQLGQRQDLVECLKICIGQVEAKTIGCGDAATVLRSEIGRVFGTASTRGVVLSSIHKAKGLEWHSVYILQPFSLPLLSVVGPDAKKPSDDWGWEQKQEQNVAYVAVTRAKSELFFLKHIKGLSENHRKIVEVFGEEVCDEQEHEHWWDEQQSKGGSFDQDTSTYPGLNRASAAQLLGVSGGASPGEVNAAFKKLAVRWHPDKVQDEHEKQIAKLAFPKMLAARDLLMA